jgi:hypothetical protein
VSTQLHSALKRTTTTLIAATLGISLFATGVWAGSAGGGSEPPTAVQARDSFWSYDPRTGNPTGPAGEPDFWNYDPKSGAKISDYSPGVAPEDLAALWSVER